MQNKFEKQVQQKMDELHLVPSEPVWQNIAGHIKNKRERRRGIIIWFAMFVLLLGAGTWLVVNNQKKLSDSIGFNAKGSERRQTQLKQGDAGDVIDVNPQTQKGAKKRDGGETNRKHGPNSESLMRDNMDIAISPTSKTVPRRVNGKNRGAHLINLVARRFHRPFHQTSPDKGANSVSSNFTELLANPIKEAQSRGEVMNKKLILFPVRTSPPSKVSENILRLVLLEKSLKEVRAEKLTVTKTRKVYKWEKGLTVTAGISSESNGVNLFQTSNRAVSANQSLIVPFANVLNNNPIVRKGLALGIGLSLKKQLAKRLVFSAGLGYRYYSTSYLVGSSLSPGTMVVSVRSRNQYFLSPVNSATILAPSILPGNNNATPASASYRNNFHYLSLPLALDYSLFTRIPLQLHGGLSLEQLVATNALLSDPNTGIFYKARDAFTQTNLFATFGFTYSLKKTKMPIQITPHLDYGLLKLTKEGIPNHLVFAGVTTGFYFK